jgi:hypothetical protein
MKPVQPHDPHHDAFDDLIVAALHGDLSPAERAQFDSRLQNDPAARAAYLEAQAMHDLLEKTHKSAQPNSAFEQRMVSGVRRKLETEKHRETAWESVVAIWRGVKRFFGKRRIWEYAVTLAILLVVAGVALGPMNGIRQAYAGPGWEKRLAALQAQAEQQAQIDAAMSAKKDAAMAQEQAQQQTDQAMLEPREHLVTLPMAPAATQMASPDNMFAPLAPPATATAPADATVADADGSPAAPVAKRAELDQIADLKQKEVPAISQQRFAAIMDTEKALGRNRNNITDDSPDAISKLEVAQKMQQKVDQNVPADATGTPAPNSSPAPTTASAPAEIDTRKLIRNAQLDLEVKSFQDAMDRITALTKAAGGYVDTSNSQKGGNGKLQGTVVVKVLPQNLDDFLLKLRDLGVVQNQSVSTDDVTKDYFDTQARLTNSQRMETQLQELLKRENGKVSDLLQVERELARVRGEIEQMQGQLKLYDFQVQFATVTINLREKDLNQAGAYLLKEQDEFALFATDVEATFQKARKIADDFKAEVLNANLNHNSGSDVSADLMVMVPPDQIESFLAEVRGLGRVANFTRQTQRVARDGGDSQQPADETATDKDKVQVQISIRSDDETRKQVALTVVAKAVDDALAQAKTAALANDGVSVLNSSLNKAAEGQSTAQLAVRVPGKAYEAVMAAFKALGRASALSIQRNDDSGPGGNGDDAPVIISLSLTDDETPVQATQMTVVAGDVDAGSQQIKKDAAVAGIEVKASSFVHQPDGTEEAQMTFHLPMGKYPAFLESVKALGKVESLSVRRDDRPDQTVADDSAPVEIALDLHNQRDIVPDDSGIWSTLRETFGEGANALFGSVRVIGVAIAFIIPWLVTLVVLAWAGRRVYVWRKNR